MADEVLSNSEIDCIVENFSVSALEDIGSLDWFNDREMLYKLYQVAVIEGSKKDFKERVTASVQNFSKVETFVKELLSLSVWKEKILPEMFKFSPHPEQAFPSYIILYSEVLLVGIIQNLLFHDQLYCDLGDLCLDLIDYAVAQITVLSPKDSFRSYLKEKSIENKNYNVIDEIKEQKSIMSFDIGTTCITILRYISENFDNLPLNVPSRMYNTHDVPIVMVHLIEQETWCQRKDDKIYKYDQSKWKEWKIDDPLLCSVDCQVWLLLRQLLLNKTSGTLYYFSNFRKEQLSKLVRHLHDRVIDQLSPLADLKLWLHKLSISGTQAEHAYNSLIMDVSTQFRETLYKAYEGKWTSIAHSKARLLLYPQRTEIEKIAKGFATGLDGFDKICDELNRCIVCFQSALQRCSRCKNAWYCSRSCQVSHWSIHKKVCCE